MKKTIFLDVDGVLNRYGTKESIPNTRYKGIDEELFKRFKRIVDETGAEVVVHSTWRNDDHARSYLRDRLTAIGAKYRGCTVCLGDKRTSEMKSYEIAAYLENNPDIVRYVIIDDDWQANGGTQGTFFQINEISGLTEVDANNIIAYLNR